MNPETHLFIIWEKGRFAQNRILDDIREHFRVIYSGEMRFPGDAKRDYCRFYNTRRFNVRKKVRRCGSGPFMIVIVEDLAPIHVIDEFGKEVNALMYERKALYRSWAGRKFRVHGTLQSSEYERDVFRVTGHSADEWRKGVPAEMHMELPPFDELPEELPGVGIFVRLKKHLFRCIGKDKPCIS